MKKIILLLLIFLPTAVFPLVIPTPEVKVEINENAITEIDSIIVEKYDSEYNETLKVCQKIIPEVKTYYFGRWTNEGTFLLILKDKTEIKTKKIRLNNADKLVLSKKNGTYNFEEKNDFITSRLLRECCIVLLVLFLIKLPSSRFIKSTSKKELKIKYSLYYLVLVLISTLLFGTCNYFGLKIGIVIILIVLIVPNLIDLYFLFKYSKEENEGLQVLMIILGNILLSFLLLIINTLTFIMDFGNGELYK